jgi:phenylpropionate dioxygenase-like ring-hydroxylating dioxygenase large terminal subunit
MATHAERNYPLLCWWVAATSKEVTRTPISRYLLEQRVVLFRTEGGDVSALEDRCAHRWAPLSRGKVIGDHLACPYHGFRYNSRGACTLVPLQTGVPTNLRVKAYPVRERGNFVWIWLGDPDKADPALLPDIPGFDDPTTCKWQRYFGEIKCNYMLIHENVLDLTHITHLHSESFRQDDGPSPMPLPVKVEATGHSVAFQLVTPDVPLEPALAHVMGVEVGARVDHRIWGSFASPGCHVQEQITELLNAKGGRHAYVFHGLHCLTPMTPRRTHYWQAHALNYGHTVVNFTEHTESWTAPVVREDVEILEAIQESLDSDTHPDTPAEFLVASDRAVVEARRILKRMLDQEQQC